MLILSPPTLLFYVLNPNLLPKSKPIFSYLCNSSPTMLLISDLVFFSIALKFLRSSRIIKTGSNFIGLMEFVFEHSSMNIWRLFLHIAEKLTSSWSKSLFKILCGVDMVMGELIYSVSPSSTLHCSISFVSSCGIWFGSFLPQTLGWNIATHFPLSIKLQFYK